MNKAAISLAVFGLLFAISCQREVEEFPSLVIGEDFTNSNIRLIRIDTFSLEFTTIKFDSINTSSTDRLLFGYYEDESFGKVRCSPYFELSPINYDVPNDAELDSIGLILAYDQYFYNDTTQTATLRVHLLEEQVFPGSDQVFYNTSSLDFDPTPLTIKEFLPEPRDEDSLYVALPFEFGNSLFKDIQDGIINDNLDLFEKFTGFTLQSSRNSSGAVMGFSMNPTETYLRFFYSTPDEVNTNEGTLDFVIDQSVISTNAFNQIIVNSRDLPLEQLIDQEINLASSDTENLAYYQSGAGYATRIRLPTIKNLDDIMGTGTILEATLKIKPLQDAFQDIRPISDSLDLAILDKNNEITQPLTGFNGPVVGVINLENQEFNNPLYEIPIGVYIDQVRAQDFEAEDALVLFPRNYNKTLERALLFDNQNEEFKAVVEILYAIYDEDDGL